MSHDTYSRVDEVAHILRRDVHVESVAPRHDNIVSEEVPPLIAQVAAEGARLCDGKFAIGG